MSDTLAAVPALTMLSEEEELFRQSVRDFAAAEVLPHVREMDEAGKFRPDLIAKFLELGVMGGVWGVTASAAICVDVMISLWNNCTPEGGREEQKPRSPPRLTASVLGAF